MKTLVIYYSRTGTTKKVAEMIAEKMGADIEEIKDTVDRSGVKGYLKSGRDAMKKRLTKLMPLQKNLAEYDLLIIGTPIWGWNMSAPVRTFVTDQKDNIKNAAFFCTMGGSGDERAFSEMEEIIEKKPKDVLSLMTKNVATGGFEEKVNEFVNSIKEK
ncbi:MAG: flavodoxin [Parcubacteria group bacterium]|jgi:flavodoxin